MIKVAPLKARKLELIKERDVLLKKDVETDDGMNEEEKCRYSELADKIADLAVRIQRAESANEEEGDTAEPVADADEVALSGAPHIKKTGRKLPQGMNLIHFMMAAHIARKSGSFTEASRYAMDKLGNPDVAKAVNSTTQVDGGALIPQDFSQDFIPLLYAESVVRQGNPRIYSMPMGNLTLPRVNLGATATWQGELDDIGASQPKFDDLQLSAKKLTAMVAASNDEIRRSPLSVENIIREDMARQLGLAEDLAYLLSDGTVPTKPTGLVGYALPAQKHTVAAIAGTVTGQALVMALADVFNSMIYDLKGQNVNTKNAKWIWHPYVSAYLRRVTDSVGQFIFKEELDRGQLFGYPVLESTQLPTNLATGSGGTAATNGTQIFFAAFDELVIADTLNIFADVSGEASYVDPTSHALVSAFSKDQTVFRLIKEVDFGVRHPAAISISTVAGFSPAYVTVGDGAAYSTQTANTGMSAAGSIGTVPTPPAPPGG